MNKILFVDDDTNFLKVAQHLFQEQLDVDIAENGEEGLARIKGKGPFSVIISDLLMPGMDGFEFIEKAGALSPDSVFIILSGHADIDASLKALNEGNVFRFLVKPYKVNALKKAVEDGLAHYHKKLRTSRMSELGDTGFYRRKILFVDDDPEILSNFSAAMAADDQFDVLTAENGQVALTILGLMQMDMVIADSLMPEVDGVALLSAIRRRDPDIILFLSTWQPSPELDQQVSGLNLSGILEKPMDMKFILKTIQEVLQAGPRGKIDGIGTGAFLQMIEMEEKTCALHVHSGERLGFLFFQKGRLIAAETKGLENLEAAVEIINWKDAAITIEHADKKKKLQINLPLIHILMEAAKKQDEENMAEDEGFTTGHSSKASESMETGADGR